MPNKPVIQFPETAQTEWNIVADAAQAEDRIREKIEHDTLVDVEVGKLRRRHEANLIFQQELDADSTPTLEMTTLSNYKSDPGSGPVDLIEGVMTQDAMCLMLGPSGSGKSTLALQMLHSLSTGEDWLGQKVKPIMGSHGIVSYDMDSAMLLDWMEGFPNMDPSKVSVVNAHKRGNPLGVPQMRAQIAATWRQMNVEVVTIDSFSASFFGADQNDAASTQHHYRDLLNFALTEVGARALIVIVHSTQSSPDKARGSTVHHDVADTIVNVVADPQTQERTVRMTKYRAARGMTQMDPVIITAPDSVTHLCDVDTGAMAMQGMRLPNGMAAQAFTVLPDTHDDPDISTDSDSDEEDMDL